MKIKIDIGFSNDYIEDRVKTIKNKYLADIVYDDYDGLKDIDFLLATKLKGDDLDDSNCLKEVFVPFTGVNKFPLEKLNEKNIKISNTHAKAHIVAERAMALTLSLMGKIVSYDHEIRNNHRWLTREYWGSEFWNSLFNKKCGIVGMGAIGQNIKSLLSPFNCEIINLKRDESKALANTYSENINEMMETCDVLFLTCTLNEETRHLINNDNIHLLKDKFIINVSRGDVIQEKALFRGLDENIILGAGIDVWYAYPQEKTHQNPSNYDLSSFKNLVMSPHASCHAIEAKHLYYEDIFNQIENAINETIK